MTAMTAQDFETAALARLSDFPTVAAYVQAGDPRVLAQIRAQAAMLGMLSEQIDNTMFEAFVKTRDSTVLADASLKGVLPLGRACRVSLQATNGDTSVFNLAAGRRIMDQKGRIYTVDSDTAIPAGSTVSVAATQKTDRVVTVTVQAAQPFYRMEVTPSDADTYLNSLDVYKGDDEFTYAPDWFNVQPGDLAYQVETDEQRRLYVCMGSADVVGYGVQPGDVFTLKVTECEGKITDLAVGADFALEYVYTVGDGKLTLILDSVTDSGAAPATTADLRVMASYPAIYDHNAVYLGEFDFLLRRYLTGVVFLSVWNEQIEEYFRGPSVDQINRLFVSGRVDGMDTATFQARVTELIRRADDSYKVVFVEPVDYAVSVTVTGTVSVVHDPATVEAQVRGGLLSKYAAGSPDVSRGMSNPLRARPMGDLLEAQVPAFQDDQSDFNIQIAMVGTPLPEQFVQITDDSLEVDIEFADTNSGLWNQ